MRASEEIVGLIKEYYGLMDDGRLDECERYFTPDATLQIAHYPKIEGWPTIARVMRGGLANPAVERISHDLRNAWEEDDTIIYEVAATYEMTDGRTIVVPGVVIAEVVDGRFKSQRIAADLSPTHGA